VILLDTHVLVWALGDDNRLGPRARAIINNSLGTRKIHVSAITLWEIAMLAEKGRLALGREVGDWIDAALALPGIVLEPIVPAIALDSVRLPGIFHADPADRFIVATARHTSLTLLTADGAILEYGKSGHVSVVDASR